MCPIIIHIISHHNVSYISLFESASWAVSGRATPHSVTYCMQKYYFKQHIKLTKHSSQILLIKVRSCLGRGSDFINLLMYAFKHFFLPAVFTLQVQLCGFYSGVCFGLGKPGNSNISRLCWTGFVVQASDLHSENTHFIRCLPTVFVVCQRMN